MLNRFWNWLNEEEANGDSRMDLFMAALLMIALFIWFGFMEKLPPIW